MHHVKIIWLFTLLARFVGYKETGALQRSIKLRDEVALRALASLLAHANSVRGSVPCRAVEHADEVVNDAPNLEYLLHRASLARPVFSFQSTARAGLSSLPASLRLPLEMSLHEDDERRAMEGELKEFEQRWRDADMVAKIADEILIPEIINARIADLHSERDRSDQERTS